MTINEKECCRKVHLCAPQNARSCFFCRNDCSSEDDEIGDYDDHCNCKQDEKVIW